MRVHWREGFFSVWNSGRCGISAIKCDAQRSIVRYCTRCGHRCSDGNVLKRNRSSACSTGRWSRNKVLKNRGGRFGWRGLLCLLWVFLVFSLIVLSSRVFTYFFSCLHCFHWRSL